jgi:hypothetical protein
VHNKCISYRVNPRLLAEGVPIESLEKFDIKEVPFQEISGSWRSRQSRASTPKPPSEPKERKPRKPRPSIKTGVKMGGMIDPEQGQAIKENQEIKVSAREYLAIMKGKRVHLKLDNPEKYAGKMWRIVNAETGSYCMKTLVLIGQAAIAII